MNGIFKYIINKNYHLRGMLLLGFFIFSLPVFANPYFSMLASAPQSAKYREVQVTTNDWGWSCKNEIGTITNATFTWWGRCENGWFNKAPIMIYATTEAVGSHGEDVLAGSLGWDDSWLALTGETNVTTSLITNSVYCLVGTAENSCDIDFGGITNTVVGDFDFLARNVDNNLRIDTTGNFRLGMILAETNKCIVGSYINNNIHNDPNASARAGSEDWTFNTTTFQGMEAKTTTYVYNSSNTTYTTTLDEPFEFGKGSEFKFGYAQLATGAYTNMFFDMRGYAGILATDKTSAIRFDGLCELENRGWSSVVNYALIFDGVDDYVDTGIMPNETLGLVFKYKVLSIPSGFNTVIFGSSGLAFATPRLYLLTLNGMVYGFRFGDVSFNTIIVPESTTTHTVKIANKTWFFDGIEILDTTGLSDFACNFTIAIGAVNAGGTAEVFSEIIVYDDLTITTNGILARDFVVRPKGSTLYSSTPMSENGFRDRVTGEEFINQGTGELGIEVVE